MELQDKILTRQESVMVNSGRLQSATPLGDLWVMLPNHVEQSVRFEMAAEYNALEDAIDDVIDSGFQAYVTHGDFTIHGISKAPNRPKPPTS